jgi:hypothetical protein
VNRIRRLVFWLDGVVVQPSSGYQIPAEMAELLDDLQLRLELAAVASYEPQHLATIIAGSDLHRWFDDEAIYPLPHDIVDHRSILRAAVAAGAITLGESLWIDHDPLRTMLAVRQGIDASIFVDARRLYRDLWLWGLVPPVA